MHISPTTKPTAILHVNSMTYPTNFILIGSILLCYVPVHRSGSSRRIPVYYDVLDEIFGLEGKDWAVKDRRSSGAVMNVLEA